MNIINYYSSLTASLIVTSFFVLTALYVVACCSTDIKPNILNIITNIVFYPVVLLYAATKYCVWYVMLCYAKILGFHVPESWIHRCAVGHAVLTVTCRQLKYMRLITTKRFREFTGKL